MAKAKAARFAVRPRMLALEAEYMKETVHGFVVSMHRAETLAAVPLSSPRMKKLSPHLRG